MLNVLGRDMVKGRYLRDRLDLKAEEASQYYNERDLLIGRVLNVFGRQVMLTDCDGQTKEFYRKKYGIEEFSAILTPSNPNKFTGNYLPERKLMPPFNGEFYISSDFVYI